MRVVVLRNSIAGRGLARRVVDRLVARLSDADHHATVLDVNRDVKRDEQLVSALRSTDALIIAGGDGTVHHTFPLAIEARVPILHYPLGTENLFAREFGLSINPATILAALERRTPHRVDVGLCHTGTETRHFCLMGSVGFDSCIVERLAASRRGGITHLHYIRHGAHEFLCPRFVPLSIRIDGRELVADQPGMVVVANSRQYCGRLDPARNACMTDGSLDLVFLPIRSRTEIVRRLSQVFLGRHMHDASVLHARGVEISITPRAPIPLQLDGEFAGILPAGRSVGLGLHTERLNVLAP